MLKRIILGCAAAALTLGLAASEEPLQVASGLHRAPDGSLAIVAGACAGHGIQEATREDDTHADGNPNNVNSLPVDFRETVRVRLGMRSRGGASMVELCESSRG